MQEIAQHMKSGKIRTYARYWSTFETDIVAARRRDPPTQSKRGMIDVRYFSKALNFADQVSSWNWEKSMFWCTAGHRSLPETRIYRSVRFSKTDIENWIKEARQGEREKKKRGGAVGNVEQWHRVWMAILEVLQNPQSNWANNKNLKSLRDDVYVKLGGPYPLPSELEGLSGKKRDELRAERCPFAAGTMDDVFSRVAKRFGIQKSSEHPKT